MEEANDLLTGPGQMGDSLCKDVCSLSVQPLISSIWLVPADLEVEPLDWLLIALQILGLVQLPKYKGKAVLLKMATVA